MSDAEVSEIAGFLLDCSRAVHKWSDTPEMMLYLHRLWQIVPMMRAASCRQSSRAERVALAMLLRMARRRCRQIEERLAVRN